jgi:transcription termination/antitermination protein NusG
MLKLSDNPPLRPPSRESILEFGADWWVAHTKSRNEKLLAFDLLARGIDYFLPLVPKTIFSGGRKRKVLHPLFGGYLFFNGTRDQRVSVLQTDRTCNIIEVRNTPGLVESLRVIELALDNNVQIDAYPFAVVGKAVRVMAGPMAGVVGTIARRDEVDRLYISVEMLGQCVEIQIETSLLRPLDD